MESKGSVSNSNIGNDPFTFLQGLPIMMNRRFSINSVNYLVLQNMSNRMIALNEMMVPIEHNLINEECPNPDAMSYEQLLELQEKIGFVDKGFKKEDIEVY